MKRPDRKWEAAQGKIFRAAAGLLVRPWLSCPTQLHGRRQATGTRPGSQAVDEIDLKAQAIIQAEQAVKLCLKHPLDARFPFLGPDVRTDKLNSKVSVTGTVEAKNDFGGTLTSAYVVRFTNQAGTLRTDRVVIDGKVMYENPAVEEDRVAEERGTQELHDKYEREVAQMEADERQLDRRSTIEEDSELRRQENRKAADQRAAASRPRATGRRSEKRRRKGHVSSESSQGCGQHARKRQEFASLGSRRCGSQMVQKSRRQVPGNQSGR